MSCLLYFLMIICSYISSSLFLSENRLIWNDANQYCNYCNSKLLSLHDNITYIQILNEYIPNSIDISSAFSTDPKNNGYWIGLNKISSINLEWNDDSTFNFGNILTGGSYPWQTGEPSGGSEDCVHLWNEVGYKWNDLNCNGAIMRFMCNDCKGKLEKYILVQQSKNWNDAKTFCSTYIGTSLASIHSTEDQDNIYRLCALRGVTCWIGLNDISSDGNWVWSDGTTFDYGTDSGGGVTSGQYPWANSPDNEPNGGTKENCIELHKDKGYRWNDESCSTSDYFICNKPSEVCFGGNWKIMKNTDSLSWSNCEMNGNGNSIAIITDKQWIYSNDLWRMEYIYTINNIFNGYGESGITLYHFDSICDYYHIGIAIDSANNAFVFIYQYMDDIKTQIFYSNVLFTYQFGKYYQLNIQLSYTTQIVWTVSINNVIYINAVPTNTAYLTHSKYVGIENKDVDMTAKSLFISETPLYIFTDPQFSETWLQCTSTTRHPTSDPTIDPTNDPTKGPTFDPTKDPTKDPTMDPTTDPTADPTIYPTKYPSKTPTYIPSNNPSKTPTYAPYSKSSKIPTYTPSNNPSKIPTRSPVHEIAVDYEAETTSTTMSIDGVNVSTKDNIWDHIGSLWIYIIPVVALCFCVTILMVICLKWQHKLDKESDDKKDDINNNAYLSVLNSSPSKQTPRMQPKEGMDTLTTIQLTKVMSMSATENNTNNINKDKLNNDIIAENENDEDLDGLYTVSSMNGNNTLKVTMSGDITNSPYNGSNNSYNMDQVYTIGAPNKSINSLKMKDDAAIYTVGAPNLPKTEKIEDCDDDNVNYDNLYGKGSENHITPNDDFNDDNNNNDNDDELYKKRGGRGKYMTPNQDDNITNFNHDINVNHNDDDNDGDFDKMYEY